MVSVRGVILFLALISSVVAAQDATAPMVAITSPAHQSQIGGLVTVEATASDDVGVASVNFYKDQTLVDTDTTAPFAAVYNFNADAPDASYTVTVTASDHAGNQTSAEIVVHKPQHDFRPPGCTLAENGAFFKVWAPTRRKSR